MSIAPRLALAGLLLLTACSTPPRGKSPAHDPAASDAAGDTATAEDSSYDFEKEEPTPEPPGDVAFEEDELPPRPEDVAAGSLAAEKVSADDVRVEDLPPEPVGDRIEPTVTTPVAPAVTTPVPQGSEVEIVRGFRVQLFAVTDLAKASTMAAEAGQRLGIEVHVVSEGGHFKVRAGDFTDRGDAVLLKSRAASLGYDGAWVVTDEVELRK